MKAPGRMQALGCDAGVAADVAMDVQAFYDRYPYPPPLHDLEGYRQRWLERQRRQADFHLYWPTAPYRENYSILIAGCGTSQAAKHALRRPEAEVTGIDLSATSVHHTEELKRKYQLDNLRVHQLPLERVGELGTTFDQVVCTGVLHHLADPDAGLRALRAVLKPEGALHLMVYAPYGRTGIYMLQEFFRRVGFRAPDSGSEDLLAALKALPAAHPLVALLREAPDFRSEPALADALLHPRDRAYSVPQLLALLRSNRMIFGRWVRQAPYSLQAGITSRIPRSMRLAHLAPEDQYAAAELFRGTMMRHSLVAYRDDHPAIPCVTFAGDGWLGYVPIRLPDTICVQEQLPPGITAMLINRTHTHTDICLPIRSHEKRLVDGIDGKRSIEEILSEVSERALARSLFERLWWHDQVVFDATHSAPTQTARES
jgi:SAM-dependent methyltransferase